MDASAFAKFTLNGEILRLVHEIAEAALHSGLSALSIPYHQNNDSYR